MPAVLLTFAPKCFLCVAAYAGAGFALRSAGAELCGASPVSANPWLIGLAGFGIVAGAIGLGAARRRYARQRESQYSQRLNPASTTTAIPLAESGMSR